MPIQDFERIVDSFNEAISSAKSIEEQLKISIEFESIIDAAEKELEESLEAQFKAELDALEKEQKESEPVEEPLDNDDDLLKDMIDNLAILDEKSFANIYKVKDIRALAEFLGLPTREDNNYIKESALVSSIYINLDNIEKIEVKK